MDELRMSQLFLFTETKPFYRADPAGTWKYITRSSKENVEALEKAKAQLDRVPEKLRNLFACFIDRGIDEETQSGAQIGRYFFTYALCDSDTKKLLSGFEQLPGVEIKKRVQCFFAAMTRKAFYVPEVGTLEITSSEHFAASFSLGRDTFFLDSYRDHAKVFDLPKNVWEAGVGNCVKLSEAGDKVASVKTFDFRGMPLIYVSACYAGKLNSCEAWSVCHVNDWNGETYTHSALMDRYADGSKERGDHRGQLVSIKGKRYVLDEYYIMRDAA